MARETRLLQSLLFYSQELQTKKKKKENKTPVSLRSQLTSVEYNQPNP